MIKTLRHFIFRLFWFIKNGNKYKQKTIDFSDLEYSSFERIQLSAYLLGAILFQVVNIYQNGEIFNLKGMISSVASFSFASTLLKVNNNYEIYLKNWEERYYISFRFMALGFSVFIFNWCLVWLTLHAEDFVQPLGNSIERCIQKIAVLLANIALSMGWVFSSIGLSFLFINIVILFEKVTKKPKIGKEDRQ
ncbi:hypothetical protein [Fructobacillus tropaeoli]|uniref:ABC transporter, solute-binding protein n=1 Tax=Fructobacillus tropaeoli TaxID=709323 RepID=A0A3F3H5A2_9LACO|nr:hypothetical protein [Fructobacillus tropaeoli]GAP04897.1 ABC transporter, solute-binding protein [Fructobacillus tropaeoli]